MVKAGEFTPLARNTLVSPDDKQLYSIAETFGPRNEVGLKAHPYWRDADIVWVKSRRTWMQFFYNDQDLINDPEGLSVGWKAVGWGDADFSDFNIPEDTCFFIESKKDVDWIMGWGGFIRRSPMLYNVINGFNFLNRGFPIPTSLGESGIQLSRGFNKRDENSTGDIVWLWDEGQSMYNQYYYDSGEAFPFFDEGWKKVAGGNEDHSQALIPSALIIETKGSGGLVVSYPPSGILLKKTVHRYQKLLPTITVYPQIEVTEQGNPYFIVRWYAKDTKTRYYTEVFEGWRDFSNEWFSIGEGDVGNFTGDLMYSWANLSSLRWGVARISYIHTLPPNKGK